MPTITDRALHRGFDRALDIVETRYGAHRVDAAFGALDCAVLKAATVATFHAESATFHAYLAAHTFAGRVDDIENRLTRGGPGDVGPLALSTGRLAHHLAKLHHRADRLHETTVADYHATMVANRRGEMLPGGTLLVWADPR